MMKKVLSSFFAVIALMMGFVYWYIHPILKPFPQPTGKYGIGTTLIELKDTSRREIYSQNTNDVRRLMVRVWYPSYAKASEGRSSFASPVILSELPFGNLYRRTADRSLIKGSHDAGIEAPPKPFDALSDELFYIAPQLAQQNNIPEWLARIMMSNIKTHAYSDASLVPELTKYPVILFSHGLLGFGPDFYTSIIEELVSHGFIVVAVNHAYLNLATVYSDGKVVTSEYTVKKFQKMTVKEQYEFRSQAMDVYKKDLRFVMDQLEVLDDNPQSMFYKRLNLDRIGILGHSGGGTAAIETCRDDERCKAVINMDGWFDEVIGWEPLKAPLLLMFVGNEHTEIEEPTQEYLKRKELTREQYFELERKIKEHKKALCSLATHCKTMYISNIKHSEFGDELLLKWPLRAWNAPDSYAIIKEINDHILWFFDTHLKFDLMKD